MKIHGGHGCSVSATNPGRIFMLTALLLPPSLEGGSHNLSLRLMSPLTAQAKRKGGEGNEERMERGWRVLPWLESYEDDLSLLLLLYSIYDVDIRIHAQTILSVLGVAPRALLCKAALFHRGFVEFVFDV